MSLGKRVDDTSDKILSSHLYKPPAKVEMKVDTSRIDAERYRRDRVYKTAIDLLMAYLKDLTRSTDYPFHSNPGFLSSLHIIFDDNFQDLEKTKLLTQKQKNFIAGFSEVEKDRRNRITGKIAFILDTGTAAEAVEELVKAQKTKNKRIIEKAKNDIENLIHKTVRHEFFHAWQFYYLISQGGQNAYDRYAEYVHKTSYNNNIFEVGAYAFEDPKNYKIQNIEKDLEFLVKELPGILSRIGKLFGR